MSKRPPQSRALPQQPYDELLLKRSRLYRRSRELYRAQGGTFEAALWSSPRSLGSPLLLENHIGYSPLGAELEWSLTDRLQKREKKHLEQVRSFVTNVFHEQSHRILWRHFREAGIACPQSREEAFRFLNLVEALVVILDMALGDDLGMRVARPLYGLGVVYNPGSTFMSPRKLGPRGYRNALQVALHATYLRLEGMHADDIPGAVRAAFPGLSPKLVDAATRRALLIEPLFVELTNPIWQKRHVKVVMREWAPRRGAKPLRLPHRKPTENHQAYLIAETWLARFGL
ncbi:MAG: hypothetical protein AB7P04_09815 [Bacteriovoracia bacterium]